MRRRFPIRSLLAIALVALIGCGGGTGEDPPPVVHGLIYTNPTGSGWRLVQNASSTTTKVVLDLVPPDGSSGLGVGFVLVASARLQWAKVDALDGDFLHNRAFDLGTQPAMARGLARDGELQVGVFQKGLDRVVTYQGAVLSVALGLGSGAPPPSEVLLPIQVRKAKHVGVDGSSQAITIQVGELKFRP